jgi:hypothetical protein
MAACAVCGTGLRAEATHCTTCGTPTGVTAPAASVPSPFETGAGWSSPPSPFESGASWNAAGPAWPGPAARLSAAKPPRSKAPTMIIIGALVVVIAALIAIVALPRLFSTVDPQKYVGTWAYTGNAADRIVITRQGGAFTIVFVGQNGTRQSLPGKIADKRLVIDFAALGPDGKIVKKLAESIGAKLSFSYRKSDDRLLLSGANANQGSFTIVMQRSSPA